MRQKVSLGLIEFSWAYCQNYLRTIKLHSFGMKFWQNASLCIDCIAKIKPFLLPKTSWAQIATKALLKSLNLFSFFQCCNFTRFFFYLFNLIENLNIFTEIEEILKFKKFECNFLKGFFTIVLNLAKNLLAKNKTKRQRPKEN